MQMDSIWIKDNVWYHSPLIKNFIKKAKSKYPPAESAENATWPKDLKGISENIAYLFPSHVLKVIKSLCNLLNDEESLSYLSLTNNLTIVDLACGPGTASIGFIDFIDQLIKSGIIKRKSNLQLSFIINDLESVCIKSALQNLNIIRSILSTRQSPIIINSILTATGSIYNILRLFKNNSITRFDLLYLCNAFDNILIHGDEVLKENSDSDDPITNTKPCDRPRLLADLFIKLGYYSNPYFSRGLLLQEWRYAPLIALSLSSNKIKVIKTRMNQNVMRPDIQNKIMSVRFGYCGFKYGYSNETINFIPTSLPFLNENENLKYFHEDAIEF